MKNIITRCNFIKLSGATKTTLLLNAHQIETKEDSLNGTSQTSERNQEKALKIPCQKICI